VLIKAKNTQLSTHALSIAEVLVPLAPIDDSGRGETTMGTLACMK
jgi:hypothetical protein